MNLLGQSAFLKALGWALLNSLWQFGLLWMILIVLINSRKTFSPAVKHAAALACMLAGFAWFIFGLSHEYFNLTDIHSRENTWFSSWPLYEDAYRFVYQLLDVNLSYLSAVYLLIVGSLFLRFARYFLRLHKLQTKGVHKPGAGLRLYVNQLAQLLSIRRKVQVWLSDLVDTPMIIGFLRPTILIPVASLNQLSVQQLEAILLHELVHIKRNDYLVNVCIASIEIIFFFNPFTRLLIRIIKQEREKCCDDWVLQFRFNPLQYASALVTLEKNRSSDYAAGIAATGENNMVLLSRIERIMGVKATPTPFNYKLPAYCIMTGMLVFIAMVNPAGLVVKNLKTNPAGERLLAVRSSKQYERNTSFINNLKLQALPKKVKTRVTMSSSTPIPAPEADERPVSNEDFLLNVSIKPDDDNGDDNGLDPAPALIEALNIEKRDFSIAEKVEPSVPPVAGKYSFPFVPNSSFSYSVAEDTSGRPKRLESYSEHVAHEAMVKAQKALEQVDWKKIEKQLKNTKTDVTALKNEILQSLQNLNWQQINQQVNDSLDVETSQRMRTSLKKEYENMKLYQERQQQYQQLQDMIKQQQQEYKINAETKLIELQQQVKKQKTIVHI